LAFPNGCLRGISQRMVFFRWFRCVLCFLYGFVRTSRTIKSLWKLWMLDTGRSAQTATKPLQWSRQTSLINCATRAINFTMLHPSCLGLSPWANPSFAVCHSHCWKASGAVCRSSWIC